MLRLLLLLIFLLELNENIQAQNLIKNCSFKNNLNEWSYINNGDPQEISPIINKHENTMLLALFTDVSLAQNVATVAGEVYSFNIKIFDIKGDSVFVHFYVNDILQSTNTIEKKYITSPFYLCHDFLAEQSYSELKVEIKTTDVKDKSYLLVSDVICNNKKNVVWLDYYKD